MQGDVGSFVSQEDDGFTDLGYTGQRNYTYIKLIDYGARWYSDSLGRFTQPDSIVPVLTDTQSWNRFSYVNNNPVNFNDPSGHMAEGACGFGGGKCGSPSMKGYRPIFGGGRGTPTGNPSRRSSSSSVHVYDAADILNLPVGSNFPGNEEPVFVCGSGVTMICVGQMPPDADSNVKPPNALANDVGYLGGVLDIGEAILSATGVGQPFAIGLGAIDLGVAFGGCYLAGECYKDSPGYGLPSMMVVNQDVLVTSTDLVVGSLTTPIGDAITSAASAVYDFGRASGNINNYVSVGYSKTTPDHKRNDSGVFYIMYYP